MTEKFKIFTWYLHRGYLNYFSQGNYEIYISVTKEKAAKYNRIAAAPASGKKGVNELLSGLTLPQVDRIDHQQNHLPPSEIRSAEQKAFPITRIKKRLPLGYHIHNTTAGPTISFNKGSVPGLPAMEGDGVSFARVAGKKCGLTDIANHQSEKLNFLLHKHNRAKNTGTFRSAVTADRPES